MKQKFVYLSSTSLIVICGLSFSANAQTCATQPTCESLGFTQKAADCTGKQFLKCPFDTAKVFCGGSACDSGYIYSSCSTDKGTCKECGGLYKYTSCNKGWEFNSLKECVPQNCSAIQPSENIPHCDKSFSCKSGYTTTYGCSSCEIGYERNDFDACVKMDCYNSCHYKQGFIDDAKIASMTTTRPSCIGAFTYGCFRNGTMAYWCSNMVCW